MTTLRNDLVVRLDAGRFTQGVGRLARAVDRLDGKLGSANRRVGALGGGLGKTLLAGGGIGAGAAVFEKIIEKILELFENTQVMQDFTDALQLVFKAAGPLIGVLLNSLTPAIVALTPAIAPLARAIAPLVELLGANLYIAVKVLTPVITLLARGLATLTGAIRDTVFGGIEWVVRQINKLPFANIELELDALNDKFGDMSNQLAAAGAAADGVAAASNRAAAAQKAASAAEQERRADAQQRAADKLQRANENIINRRISEIAKTARYEQKLERIAIRRETAGRYEYHLQTADGAPTNHYLNTAGDSVVNHYLRRVFTENLHQAAARQTSQWRPYPNPDFRANISVTVGGQDVAAVVDNRIRSKNKATGYYVD